MSSGIGCLCGCGRVASKRGLYNACYQRLRTRVVRGEASWDGLVRAGRAAPSRQRESRECWRRR